LKQESIYVWGRPKGFVDIRGSTKSKDTLSPTKLELIGEDTHSFDDVAIGPSCVVATGAGSVYIWADTNSPPTIIYSGANNKRPGKVCCTESAIYCVTAGGELLQWELNHDSTNPVRSSMPKKCSTYGKRVSTIESGPEHLMAIMSDGEVYSMGKNMYGQLGIGSKEKDVTSLTKVAGLEGRKILRIACGRRHTVFVDQMGNALTCGSDQWLQLGRGETWKTAKERRRAISRVPVDVSLLQGSRVVDCAAAGDTSYFVVQHPGEALASVQAAGYGQFGLLGNNTYSHFAKKMTPVRKLGELPIRSTGDTYFSCGEGHCAIAMQAANKVLSWGKNDAGQCGTSRLNNLNIPSSTMGVDGKNWPRKTTGPVRMVESGFGRSAAVVVDCEERE
jgi:alpha-tubulin suppressor-like RCC1 family protein